MILKACYFSFVALVAGAAIDPGYDCRPGQKCWPSLQEWQQFNASIDGHLFQTTPIGAACYQNSPGFDQPDCQAVQEYASNSTARGAWYGQTYWLNWESCGNLGCALLEDNPTENLYGACSLGRLASYYIDVEHAFHISEALRFTKAHNIRISIKNTGHDFFGRSSVPNSLAIWTHNLKTLEYHKNFTAHNCSSLSNQNIGELGAGIIAGEAYEFFHAQGMDITGGYEQSVGLAGGFAQGGGVGSFTTTYGLMADNAVEFEVVTADGEIRIINQCNDADLFWAMRGGGGGTFAILTKYRVQLYPSLPIHVYTFTANFTGTGPNITATQITALREIMTAHAKLQTSWSEQLVTGQVEYFPNRFTASLVLLYNDDGSKLRNVTASFAQFLTNRIDLSISENGYISYDSYASYLDVTAADARVTEPAGIFSQLASRLIPRDVFASSQSIDALVDGVVHGIVTARSFLNLTGTQVVLETPLSNPDLDHATSANRAWRDSLWHVIHVGEWLQPLGAERSQRMTEGFLEMLNPLKQLSPGGGAYLNEAHWGEPDWQKTYFGLFYDRLLEIKKQYDPTHVFDCYKCVGWRGQQDPFYSCYSIY